MANKTHLTRQKLMFRAESSRHLVSLRTVGPIAVRRSKSAAPESPTAKRMRTQNPDKDDSD